MIYVMYVSIYDDSVYYVIILITGNVKTCRKVELANSSLHLYKKS